MSKGLVWYFRRLKKMGFKELLSRFLELTLCYYDKVYFRNGWRDNGIICWDSLIFKNVDLSCHKESLSVLLTSRYKERIDFDNSSFFKSQFVPKHIDLRSVWNSSRFDDLILDSLDETKSGLVLSKLSTWMDENRPLIGVHYISTMECAIRCMNLYAVLVNLSKIDRVSDDFANTCSKFLYTNYIIIKHRISKNSSRGNHTLFEYCGLATCTNALGMYEESRLWLDMACREFDFQTNHDGSGVEQSTAYHLFNVEALTFLNIYFDVDVNSISKYNSSIVFLSHFLVNNNLVRLGDSDSSMLFTHVFVKEKLLNVERLEGVVRFDDCGILKHRTSMYSFFLKYGELGMKPLFGHGHYNFLSLIICDNKGQFITSDDQTYRYNSEERSELRSSVCHSMPCLKTDDIRQISPFSWEGNGCGKLICCSEPFIEAAYLRKDGLGLKRTVESFSKYIIVTDEIIESGANSEFFVNWNVLMHDVDFYFFIVNSDGRASSAIPSNTYARFSSFYNFIDSRKIIRKSLRVETTAKLLTIVSFDKDIDVGTLISKRFSL